MGITAKELAKKLGISATAVSMALNNKPGVSTETRALIIKAAEENGYDFSKIKKSAHSGSIYIVSYRTSNAILSYSPIFDELFEGIKDECQRHDFPVRMIQFYEKTDDLDRLFEELRISDCCGLIVIGTEIHKEVCEKFVSLGFPFILTDSYFESVDCTSVLINNAQGAYLATDYLISRFHTTPGHIKSSYSIPNFLEREAGFQKAVKENGMSPSRCKVHMLAPSIEDAMADMLEIIDNDIELARCYFCDNDILAIGAIKACKLRGLRVPEDIAFIGFDNISEGRIIEPSLTTIDVPRFSEGTVAARLLIEQIDHTPHYHSTTHLNTRLLKRFTV
ncbi:MAG: LacI family transcriptional regulator [Lachnospiraceae bacterium]|nr:LacI family transcriptional regulator [Lachnospiraceae bacterium]